jgi:hypothetical protein
MSVWTILFFAIILAIQHCISFVMGYRQCHREFFGDKK